MIITFKKYSTWIMVCSCYRGCLKSSFEVVDNSTNITLWKYNVHASHVEYDICKNILFSKCS